MPYVNDTPEFVVRTLAAAAPCAVRVVELWSHGCLSQHEHVRRLRAAGWGIAQLQIGDDKAWAWRLDHDPRRAAA